MKIEYVHGFIVKYFPNACDYVEIYQQMQAFTQQRKQHQRDTADEIWLLQHTAVYTLGLAGKKHHILNAGAIPVQQSDRGGQVTYHGLGQLVVYLLLNLPRLGWGVKDLVFTLEQSVIDLLAKYSINAQRRDKAAGVYVDGAKIAALGLRIRHGCSYHGLSLNLDMDLSPFLGINPCGYQGLAVTQLKDLAVPHDMAQIQSELLAILCQRLKPDYGK